MNPTFRRVFTVILLAAAPALLCAQNSQKLTYEQMEEFLKTAKVVKTKNINTGITNSRRATLDDGKMQHDAHLQSIDEHKAKFEGSDRRKSTSFTHGSTMLRRIVSPGFWKSI